MSVESFEFSFSIQANQAKAQSELIFQSGTVLSTEASTAEAMIHEQFTVAESRKCSYFPKTFRNFNHCFIFILLVIVKIVTIYLNNYFARKYVHVYIICLHLYIGVSK